MLSLSLFVCAVSAIGLVAGDSDVLLKPTHKGTAVGLVWVQGATSPTAGYVPVAEAIQTASELSLYIAIPAFPLDTPEPLVIDGGMKRAIASMRAAGLPDDAPIVVAAHSLGGVMLQDWTFKNADTVAAQILTGSTLLRKYRNGTVATKYPVPTMMMSGTLDGLFRVTRAAESFFHYNSDTDSPRDYPVVLFEGFAHWSFSSGSAPTLVAKSDLKPEVSSDEAHAAIGQAIANFMAMTVLKSTAGAAAIDKLVSSTAEIAKPIIQSQDMEAFIHMSDSCNSDYAMPEDCPAYPRYPSGEKKGSNPTHCTCGTPWSAMAQAFVASADTIATGGAGAGAAAANYTVVAVDAVHPVSDVNPIHLPHIWNNCTGQAPGTNCTLKTTTVTYPIYSAFDGLDTGFYPTSASELRVKLKSKQSLMEAAGYVNVNFTASDVVPSICAQINLESWKWAMSKASAVAVARFAKIGQPMAFGKDIFLSNAGPAWIENPIEYKASKDKAVLNVYSPCSHTPVDYAIASAAGYHYCKLVSPARAMEHIMLDGLRPKGGHPSS